MTINDPNFQWRPLADLHPSSTNPRTSFGVEDMEELKQSMQQHGYKAAFPIFCRPSKEQPGKLEIIAGERRFRTATDLAIEPVAVVVEDLDDKTVLEMQLIENLQRAGLSAVEEGRGYKRLLELRDEEGKPVHDAASIAARLGKSVDTIRHKMKILMAPESLLAALSDESKGISERHCLIIARIPDVKQREDAAARALKGVEEWIDGTRVMRPMTVVELKAMVREDYMVTLKGAPWKLDDADLLPEAGPCKGCAFLAGEFLKGSDELATPSGGTAGESGGKTKGGARGVDPMTCCNPGCHAKKMKAFFDRESQTIVAQGGRVLPSSESKKVFYPHGGLSHEAPYVPLDAKPGYNITGVYDDSKTPTYAKLMKDAEAAPKITLAMSPKGEVLRLIDKKAAEELARKLKKDGKIQKEAPSAAEKKEREKRLLEERALSRTRVLALSMLAEWIATRGVGIDEMLQHIELGLYQAGMDGCRLVAEWLQVEVPKKKGDHLQSSHYSKAILAHLRDRGHTVQSLHAIDSVIRVAKEVKQWGWPPECYKILAKAHGFDVRRASSAAETAVKAEAAEKAAKKAAKNAPPPAKPKSKSLSASAARNAGVIAADEATRDRLSMEQGAGSREPEKSKGGLMEEVSDEVRAKALEIYKETGSLKKAAEGSGAKLDAVRNWKRRDAAWK